jgi:hypothetical protein
MKAAFVVMSILGCDDAGIHCLPVASVAEQWPTIATCDASSEKVLNRYRNVAFPVVVAVCQTANTTALADSQADVAESGALRRDTVVAVAPDDGKQAHPGLTARALALVREAIPTRRGLKEALLEKPVHFVTDSYSWVARKISD